MRGSRAQFPALMLVAAALSVSCGRTEPARQTAAAFAGAPVIVISIDTLRADHLPAYGYRGVDTPAIDSLRADSVLFTNAWSHSPLTLPSHLSMLTGLLPPDHGVRNNLGFRFDAAVHETIPSVLKRAGYATGAAVSSYVLRGSTGLAAAFEAYDDEIAVVPGHAAGQLQRRGGETTAAALKWIDGNSSKKFFFFLHLFEPHTPYDAPEPFRSRFAPYDAEIASADAILGEFLGALKARGIYDRAIIVLLSDHGEGLRDHGEAEHGIFLYRESIHVPLLMKLPGSEKAKSARAEPVQLADLFPTIVEMTGAKAARNPSRVGRSLLSTSSERRQIFSETMYPRIHLGWSELRSVVEGAHHYIDAPSPELYDLNADPREKTNVLDANRRIASAMRAGAARHAAPLQAIGAVAPEEAANLKALGYLSSPAADTGGELPDPKDRIGDLDALSRAEALLQNGDSKGAIALLEEVVARNPRFTDALSQLARTCEEAGRFEQAIEVQKRVIRVAPTLASEVALSLASNYLMVGRPADAEANARLALRSNAPAAHLLIGRARLAQRDFASAEEEARQALTAESYAIPAKVLLAQTLVATDRERLPEALDLLEGARREIALRSLEPVPLLEFARGDVLARLNRPDEAAQAFGFEVARFPHNREAWAALAVTQILRGRSQQAQETFAGMVKENPDAGAYLLAAQTFRRFGDGERAAAWERAARAAQTR